MNEHIKRAAMERAREYQRMPWAERRQLAMQRLRRAMGIRGYGALAKPRIRCSAYKSSGRPFYAIVLTNQGRERRREVYIRAERWDTLVQKLCFDQWSQLRGSRVGGDQYRAYTPPKRAGRVGPEELADVKNDKAFENLIGYRSGSSSDETRPE